MKYYVSLNARVTVFLHVSIQFLDLALEPSLKTDRIPI